jgi:hypothetical protein
MKDVGNPPSEANLRTYYSKNGPAHALITRGSYEEAPPSIRNWRKRPPIRQSKTG